MPQTPQSEDSMGKKEKEYEYDIAMIPDYYIGKVYGYEARKIIEDYQLSYNIGTAITYLLRSSNKHDDPTNDLIKAINHLHYELDIIKNKLSGGG